MNLEERIAKIEARNHKVEADKAWELSYSRRIILFTLTYIGTGIALQILRLPDPWINAFIASIGFLLSTLVLPWFRNFWIKYIYRK